MSANVKGGGAPGLNSLSPTLIFSSSSTNWTSTGALTFNAHLLSLETDEFGRKIFDDVGAILIEFGMVELEIRVLGLE